MQTAHQTIDQLTDELRVLKEQQKVIEALSGSGEHVEMDEEEHDTALNETGLESTLKAEMLVLASKEMFLQ